MLHYNHVYNGTFCGH